MPIGADIINEGYRLAQYAAVAYLDFDDILPELRSRGLYEPGEDLHNLSEESEDVEAFAHYSKARQELVVFIRGTESAGDWLRDLAILPARWNGYIGHRGMQEGAQEILSKLIPIMTNTPAPIKIAGHSLGGGIATWLQIALRGGAVSVHTFGAPRCLGRRSVKRFAADRYSDEHCRWVNAADIVPRTLWYAYRHVEQLLFVTPDWDLLAGEAAKGQANRMRWRSIRSFGRRGFKRHSIESYLIVLAHLVDNLDSQTSPG